MKQPLSIPHLFFAAQLLFIVIHVYQYSIHASSVRIMQHKEQELLEQQAHIKEIEHTLAQLKDPQHIARYAQTVLGMKPLLLSQVHTLTGTTS